MSTPSSFGTADHTVYITQIESTEYEFPIDGWGLCKRSFCPYNSTCAWPACEKPCKPVNKFQLLDIDKVTPFEQKYPGVITDTSKLSEGKF